MITNERQYRITKAQAARFEAALASLQQQAPDPAKHPRLRQAELDAVRGQLDDLRAQLSEYEALREGRVPGPELNAYDDLPTALIRARVAAGLTQRELAERLGIPEQQVQRYEATEYQRASLARVREVMAVLRTAMRRSA